jgi:hypothetical protein
MAYKISDIPTHNTAPAGTAKIESENPTGPQSQWSTIAEILAANATGGTTWSIISSATPAVAGHGYFCDTSSAAFTLTLPTTPTLGDTVYVEDYKANFNVGNLTIAYNGNPIMGLSEDMIVSTLNASFSLVFSDVTQGWRIV